MIVTILKQAVRVGNTINDQSAAVQNWIIEATRARPDSFGAPIVLHGAGVDENTPTTLRTFGEEADAKSGDRTKLPPSRSPILITRL